MPFGSDPWVCLSGGVDSQAACLLMLAAEVKFRVAVLRFENRLNAHDVDNAILFCSHNELKYQVFDLNIHNFLRSKLNDYCEKYECPSPQITSHLWLYEQLRDLGASCIVCGGNPPHLEGEKWRFNSNRSQTAWTTFSTVNDQKMVGNFLGWSLDISLPLMLLQRGTNTYQDKINAFWRSGLPVLPQKKKSTGFEVVKAKINDAMKDGWAFEKMYRHPLYRRVPEYNSKLVLAPEIARKLTEDNRVFNP